jgi:hypothetical protein
LAARRQLAGGNRISTVGEDRMRTLLNHQDRIDPKVAVSVVYVAAMFISIMDTSIVNVALPSIGRDFRVAPTAVDGISIAFLVSLAVFIPASDGSVIASAVSAS